jgi:hypothetical protein
MIECSEEAIEIITNNRPATLHKISVKKTIWTGGFIGWEKFNHRVNFLFLERDH